MYKITGLFQIWSVSDLKKLGPKSWVPIWKIKKYQWTKHKINHSSLI